MIRVKGRSKSSKSLVIYSDIHVGSRSAICTPDCAEPTYKSSKFQNILYEKWCESIDELTQKIENSDIIIITKEEELNEIKDKVAFTIDKELLEKNANIIGAFYWNKGIPEIIFLKERLVKYNLDLSESFKKYEK